MKVFVLRELEYPSKWCYLIPANTALGACRKWNSKHPGACERAHADDFIEYSDDEKGIYGRINEHY